MGLRLDGCPHARQSYRQLPQSFAGAPSGSRMRRASSISSIERGHSMTRARLLALFSASIVAGLASVAAWQAVAPARPADTALIAPLLPQGEGRSACYAGTFTGQAMDIEDWSRARAEPTENLSPDGKP